MLFRSAEHHEGAVLKPLHAPYFPLLSTLGQRQPGYFVKLKMDYLADMGGQRDLGDFAIVGASFDAQVAAKSDLTPLHWTHFHIGCLKNRGAVERRGARPQFKIIEALSLDQCIPRPDAKWLNAHGRLQEICVSKPNDTQPFEYEADRKSTRLNSSHWE